MTIHARTGLLLPIINEYNRLNKYSVTGQTDSQDSSESGEKDRYIA